LLCLCRYVLSLLRGDIIVANVSRTAAVFSMAVVRCCALLI
jgi:hypothetical protein